MSHLFSHIKQNLHVYHYQVTQHGSASASHSKRTLMWMTRAEISSNAVSRGVHKCFETSAKTGDTVEELFTCAGKELY